MGLIVNPIAGMGGRVGLKGTDGVYKRSLELGTRPIAPSRAVDFLTKLNELGPSLSQEIVTCPRMMGEDEVNAAGLTADVLPLPVKMETDAGDTKAAVKEMIDLRVDLIVFVGGDGTARDILDGLTGKDGVPVLGVPSGVKMYSGIFAMSPAEAAEVVFAFVEGRSQVRSFEIMDVDEDAFRSDRFSMRLYGYLEGPYVSTRFLGSKQMSPETLDERENQEAVARFVLEGMDPKGTYILGPGTTVKSIADLLGVEKTLLGVDIYRGASTIKDVNEKWILQEIKDFKRAWIIVSPIGRQGMLFGRGNQQISPRVIKRVGKEKIIVAATRSKIRGIAGDALKVDTGDSEVDESLRGYIKVIVDYREWRMMRVR